MLKNSLFNLSLFAIATCLAGNSYSANQNSRCGRSFQLVNQGEDGDVLNLTFRELPLPVRKRFFSARKDVAPDKDKTDFLLDGYGKNDRLSKETAEDLLSKIKTFHELIETFEKNPTADAWVNLKIPKKAKEDFNADDWRRYMHPAFVYGLRAEAFPYLPARNDLNARYELQKEGVALRWDNLIPKPKPKGNAPDFFGYQEMGDKITSVTMAPPYFLAEASEMANKMRDLDALYKLFEDYQQRDFRGFEKQANKKVPPVINAYLDYIYAITNLSEFSKAQKFPSLTGDKFKELEAKMKEKALAENNASTHLQYMRVVERQSRQFKSDQEREEIARLYREQNPERVSKKSEKREDGMLSQADMAVLETLANINTPDRIINLEIERMRRNAEKEKKRPLPPSDMAVLETLANINTPDRIINLEIERMRRNAETRP